MIAEYLTDSCRGLCSVSRDINTVIGTGWDLRRLVLVHLAVWAYTDTFLSLPLFGQN